MTAIRVTHEANTCYRVAVGRHLLTIDQPEDAGGEDLGPTAVQLFAASLVACTAHYAGSYLARHGLSSEGMVVEGEYVMVDRPARLGSMSVTITPPVGLPEHRRAGLLAVASHCTLHNTLRDPLHVEVAFADAPIPAT